MSVVIPIIVTGERDLKALDALLRRVQKQGEKGFKKVGDGANRAKTKVTSLTAAVGTLRTVLGSVGIIGIGFAFRAAAISVGNFELAMKEVSTLLSVSSGDMKKLNDEVLRLTTEIPQDALSVAKGLYQVISAGVVDLSDALKVLEISSKAAVGGVTDTNTAVNAITTILNAYRFEVDQAEKVSDIFFTTVRLGKTKFENLANSVGIVASSAALAGVTFEELGASFGTLTKAGISTEVSATALNRLFLQMANPTKQLVETTERLGVGFSAAALRAKGFTQFMRELTEAFSEDEDAIFQLGLDLRAFRALSILGGTGAEEFAIQLIEMSKAAGAAEVAFDKMDKAALNVTQRFKNNFGIIIKEIGDVILPSFNFVMGGAIMQLQLWRGEIPGAVRETDAFKKSFVELNDAVEIFGSGVAFDKVAEKGKKFKEEVSAPILRDALDLSAEYEEILINEEMIIPIALQRLSAEDQILKDLKEENELIDKNAKIITTRLAPGSETYTANVSLLKLELLESIAATQKLEKETEDASKEATKLERATGQMTQNIVRGLAAGRDLGDVLKSAAIQLGLSFLPGGSLFTGFFAHGTSFAPGGLAVVGERGPEIVNLPRGSQVIPNNEINNTSTINIILPVASFDEFTVRTKVIPALRDAVENGDDLPASRLR